MSMQPYQEASKSSLKHSEAAGEFISNTGKIALSGAVAGRIIPLLSNLIPMDLAIKGLSKINPVFGKFFEKSEKIGKSQEETLDFIKDKFGVGEKKEQNQPNDQRSIIEQYSPELAQFIKRQIQQGRSPIEAGAIAQSNPAFQKIIKKMSEDHKTDFSSILQSIFGGGQTAQQPQQQQRQPQPGDLTPLVRGQGQQMQQGQPGPGQQSLMEIMQKINQRLGA